MSKINEVLLVDDSKADNMFHKLIITKTGLVHEVKIAKNGEEAMNMLLNKEANPDLIFLDINMPIMNGHEFLEALAEQGNLTFPKVVVMLTTSMLKEDKEKSNKYNLLSDYVNKPLTPDTVINIIEKHFG